MDNAVCLDPHDPELRSHWLGLPGGPTALDRCTHQTWQYMGTVLEDGAWVHHFRHRCHPSSHGRMDRKYCASAGWAPGNAPQAVIPTGI